MNTLLLATILAVQFRGGSANDFTTFLADATKQNVVMTQGDAKLLGPAEFEVADLGEMARAIKAQLKHTILPGNELVLSDQLLSRRRVAPTVFRGNPEREQAVEVEVSRSGRVTFEAPTEETAAQVNFIGIPPTAVTEGKVTFRTEKGDAIKLENLATTFGKPVVVHWLYSEAPVFVNVKEMPELDLMKWSAKAVGARLNVTAKDYQFELDPGEIKKRAVATIREMPIRESRRATIAEQTKARDFRVACLNALSNSQIAATLAEAGSEGRFELSPRSPLTRLALQRIREIDPASNSGNAYQRGNGILQRVDPSRSAMLMVDSRFNVRMEIPVLDANGRPAGVVRLN